MKNIKLISVFLGCFLMTISCSEEDLELTNPNQLSPDSFFKTEAQVQSAVNAVYSNMQTAGLWSRHMFFMMDNLAHENGGNQQLEADKRQYLDFSFDSSHDPIGNYWESCFRGINKANFVLGNQDAINEISNGQLSAASKSKYVGEAKFLRGMYYFYLVTRFGGVPLIIDIPEGGDGFPRSSEEEVYQQIIKDLSEAAPALLPKGEEVDGRATQGAAYAMLGKVYLFQEQYQLALDAFDQVMGYSLEAEFYDNFTEENEHGIESIFEIEYNDELGTDAQWNSSVSGAGPNEATFRGQEYGLLNWFNVYPSDRNLDEFEEGDLRYAASFYSVGDEYSEGTIVEGDLADAAGEIRRAGWRKYQNYYKDASEDQESGINMKYLRYSDVLLMMAECQNRLGNQAAAVGLINQVRDRAGLDSLSSALTQQQVFEAIVHERAVELAGEQIRFNDLLRWGIAADVLSDTNFQESKHTLLPIPDREISSNEAITAADQNPGY